MKVNRKYYKIRRRGRDDQGRRLRAARSVDQKVEKYEREELTNLATLKSGDLVEVELEIDSKNDYEYLIFEDIKAGGLRADAGPQRLQRQRPGGLHGAARREGLLLRAGRWRAASTASATGCGRKSRASSAPCRPRATPCTPPWRSTRSRGGRSGSARKLVPPLRQRFPGQHEGKLEHQIG